MRKFKIEITNHSLNLHVLAEGRSGSEHIYMGEGIEIPT